MKKTTVLIDENLLQTAIEAIGARTKKEAIEAGLKALVKNFNREALSGRTGKASTISSGWGFPAPWRKPDIPIGCQNYQCNQPGPRNKSKGGNLPRRSLLQVKCRGHDHSTIER